MLRHSISLFLLLFFGASILAQSSRAITSDIDAVTVYREGALITRQAEITVPAGRHELIFTGLTAELDPASIQLTALGDAITVLAVSHRLDFLTSPGSDATIARLRDSLEVLDRQRDFWQARREIAQEERELLAANRQFSGAQTGLNAADLERGVTFYRARITELKLEALTITDSLRYIADERQRLTRQLEERRGRSQEATSQVLATVETTQPTTVEFRIGYLVRDAGWTPHYDIRVADISEPLDLRYRAKVRQNSGEDWTAVRLTLSTGDPSRSATAPELRPWRLQPNRLPWWERPEVVIVDVAKNTVYGRITDENGDPLIGANVMVRGSSTGTVTDLDGVYQIQVPPGAKELIVSYTGFGTKEISLEQARTDVELKAGTALDEVVVSGARRSDRNKPAAAPQRTDRAVPVEKQRQPTTIRFAIELPYTIPRDNKPRDVAIRDYAVPARFEYLAIPKVDPSAYLRAAVGDWEQYDLLSGDMQLFFEGTYLGTAYLDVDNLSDTLQVSLGRDESIVLSRASVDEEQSSAFLTNRQRVTRNWVIEVRNKKTQPVQLTLLDQVPLSLTGDIGVDYDLPEDVQHDEQTGRLEWQLQIGSRETREIRFGYEIRYPAGTRLYLE